MTQEGRGDVRLADFPLVYISYDEPWADAGWAEVQKLRPDAKRVHGVKGLNACHVAAADAAGEDWFVTVDADTSLLPSVLEARFDARFLHDHFRLDWQSWNPANGLISGNGSLKLWPAKLAHAMRSHEAAPEGTVSLDADIGQIEPGRSRLVQMAGCHSVTDPAKTPYHAFRAGLRETVFLGWLQGEVAGREGAGSPQAKTLAQLITVWTTLGAHHPNGPWMIYGARLGLFALAAWPGWDLRASTDYGWFKDHWTRAIIPRFCPGGARCPLTGLTWDPARLAQESDALAARLQELWPDVPIANLTAAQSKLLVSARALPTIRTAQNLDSLGTAFNRGRIVPKDQSLAATLFESAALMMYPAAINNLARLNKIGVLPTADRGEARRLFELATALGNPHAPYHLAGLLIEDRGSSDAETDGLFDLAAERGFLPDQNGAAHAATS